MKTKLLKSTLIVAILACSPVLYAQTEDPTKPDGTVKTKMEMMDGAMMKDGKMMMMKDGKSMMMTATMEMTDGTKVMKDGQVMMKDGKTMMMKDGDMVSMDGKMMSHP